MVLNPVTKTTFYNILFLISCNHNLLKLGLAFLAMKLKNGLFLEKKIARFLVSYHHNIYFKILSIYKKNLILKILSLI